MRIFAIQNDNPTNVGTIPRGNILLTNDQENVLGGVFFTRSLSQDFERFISYLS